MTSGYINALPLCFTSRQCLLQKGRIVFKDKNDILRRRKRCDVDPEDHLAGQDVLHAVFLFVEFYPSSSQLPGSHVAVERDISASQMDSISR